MIYSTVRRGRCLSSHCHLLEEGRNRKTNLLFHQSDVPKRPNMAPENVPGNLTDKFTLNPEFHQKEPQMERPVCENDRWKGGVKSATVWIWWRNRMFPGLVRLVSVMRLVSMVFHQTHLATRAEYLEWLRQSSGSAWGRSCCLQPDAQTFLYKNDTFKTIKTTFKLRSSAHESQCNRGQRSAKVPSARV